MALQKSLLVQDQLPGHSERQAQVEDIKNRLEAIASPNIVQCFIDNNKEEAKKFVYIFEIIQRQPQLLQYYRAVQKNVLQQQWKEILDTQASSTDALIASNDTNNTLTEQNAKRIQQSFLSTFYDKLLDNYRLQVKWCNLVFETRGREDQSDIESGELQPLFVMIELLPALQPTRDNYILQLLKTSNERLEMLQQFANDNKNFVQLLTVYMEQSGTNKNQQAYVYNLMQNLAISIYGYFHKFIQQYPRLEETQLSTRIDRLLVSQAQASEAVRHIRDNTSKLFDWLSEALTRCANITEDLALWPLIQLMSSIFKRLLEQFPKTQRQLTLSGIVSDTRSRLSVSSASISSNWTTLQYTLALLECLADLQQKITSFEVELYERLRILKEKLLCSYQNQRKYCEKIDIYRSYVKSDRDNFLKAIQKPLEMKEEKRKNNDDAIADDSAKSEANDDSSDESQLFGIIHKSIRTHCVETHEITLKILLQPLEIHLKQLETETGTRYMRAGQQDHIANMPLFSFTPQEYITQIGQYLLTLPQHLEPLLLNPSSLLRQALELCHVKYTQPGACAADILLHLVVDQYCALHQARLLEIKTLSKGAAKQLATDIEYVGSVLEELGLTLTSGLKQILNLLKVEYEDFEKVVNEIDGEQTLVTIIRQMRKPTNTNN